MLKDIVERPTGSVNPPGPPQPPAPGSTGFPVALHRSQRPSAFARARQQQQAKNADRGAVAEGRAVLSIPTLQTSSQDEVISEADEVRRTVEGDNQRRVESMTEAEREQETEELKERFGNGIVDLMRRRKQAREAKQGAHASESSAHASSSRRTLKESSIGQGSDTLRILQEVSKENLRQVLAMSEQERLEEVQELEERFGETLVNALRARAEKRSFKGKEKDVEHTDPVFANDLDRGSSGHNTLSETHGPTPSHLKEKYFSNIPAEPSKLEWLTPPSTSSSSIDKATRFDLSGNVLSDSAKADLPTHLGLHHHGSSPDLAGYNLKDIIYLCRSTVPSQRITMMGVLARVISRLQAGGDEQAPYTDQVKQECSEAKVVQVAIDLGVDILSGLTRGVGVIRAGVNLLFEAVGGATWKWLDSDEMLSREFETQTASSDTPIGIRAIPFEDVLPRITELLSVEGGVDASTAQQLIVILRRATLISTELCETLCSIVPVIVRQHVVQKPWPPTNDVYPSVDALRLLRDITTSSRACAEELLRQGVYETTLKFIVTATWTESDLDSNSIETLVIGQTLALEVLRSYAALGRYGLAASIVASSADIWRRLGSWVIGRYSSSSTPSSMEQRVTSAYLDCITVWITCAIDPHRTTPEHDITWTQVAALGWTEEVLSLLKPLITARRWHELAAALQVLVAWIAGAQINAVRSGEEEKKLVLEHLRSAGLGEVVRFTESGWAEERVTKVFAGAVQLHGLLLTVGELLTSDDLDFIRGQVQSDASPTVQRSRTHLRYHLLRVDIARKNLPYSRWVPEAAQVMTQFQIGDEPQALDLLDAILHEKEIAIEDPDIASQLATLAHPDGLQILRPLIQYTILPDVEHIVGPHQPSHLYLKATATLRPPSTSFDPEAARKTVVGLPLQPDWTFSPLNELLRSGDSTALAQVPPDWSASETEIVLAALILAQLLAGPSSASDSSYILLNLMKVFMLEHGQQSTPTTSESEVFRDTHVARALQALIAPLLNVPSSPTATSCISAPLEVVATPFLGSGVPFYQFYTDFVALYEAISFSEPLFTQLLLPPLAMSYSSDYRKLLWNDHSTALRGIRTRVTEVPLESEHGLKAYFESLESDKEVLHGYARALLRGWVTEDRNEFVFKIAAHHLAGLFWDGTDEDKESTRVGLLIMVLSGGSDVLLQRMLRWDPDTLGVECVVKATIERRIETIGKLSGPKGTSRIERLNV